MSFLPEHFQRTIKNIHHKKGENWLRNFPELVDYSERKWGMKMLAPFELSYNYVAPIQCGDGSRAVIKFTVSEKEYRTETEALRCFNNSGAVKLLDTDAERGIMLLECIQPGTMLAEVKEEEMTALAAAEVMKKLWKPASAKNSLPDMSSKVESMKRIYVNNKQGLGSVSKRTLKEALTIFQQLANSQKQLYLLHGDLHHYNILRGEREPWLAIDPKGMIGERESDVIPFLLNKLPDQHKKAVIKKRISIFVKELQLNEEKILLWGFAQAVLAYCWSIEDGNLHPSFLEAACVFRDLLR
ncbi:aminoglycoside phosphotransferase family protein [Alkalicoccus halolimnae]|uniref:Aminoglycoside phosphotransferase family protein n=1 Tax=Alkalicoccus halolimnae TaxID=1667239 RepID=A0AAJ8LRG7_9BACI|nr:aminoglycoside phosphotransferase family protein [Alkalicoccus halolimnae]